MKGAFFVSVCEVLRGFHPITYHAYMRILLLGHRDIASNIALSLLISAMPQHRFSILLSGDVASPTGTPEQLTALMRFEDALGDVLSTNMEARRHCLLSYPELAVRVCHELQELVRPNSTEGLAQISDWQPDLIIAVRYRRILQDAAIAIPKFGVLNLHSGLLPEYKGVMATFWAMLNGEPIIGSTAHWIVDGTIDTGPVIGRAEVVAEPGRSYLANVLALYPSGCRLLVDTVNRIERGETVVGTRQEEAGRYYSVPAAVDVARFHKAGLRFFDGPELQEFLRDLKKSL
ncbi:MAG: formyl transferase [Woeseia sp.]